MEMERITKKNSIAFAKRERKRVLAIVLAILMVVSAMDFSGMQYVSAADESKVDIITAFTALSGEIANQQLAVGASVSEINLPNSLSVASEVYNVDEAQAVTGSAISVNPTYNLTGVTWEIDASQSSSAAFDSSVGNTYYTYVPVLPATDSEGNTVRLADGVSLPKIRVQIVGTDEASVTDSVGAVTYYDTIEEAITAAMGMSGSTVTLLKDVATENRIQMSTGNFSIDLNGKTWTGPEIWEVDGHTNYAIEVKGTPTLIFKDTVGGGLFTSENPYKYVILSFSSLCNISLEGGTYSGIQLSGMTIADLLTEGYVFRQSGTLVTDMSVQSISNVTVTPAPIKITAQPENFNADEATVSLSLTAETVPADSGKEISYQWYKEGGTAIVGATASVYILLEEPSARVDSYYCAVSCDGYTVNSRIASSFSYEASVTAADSTVTNYDTIEQAITAAMGMNGSTVKLLKDVATESRIEISTGNFSIDLNGNTWTGPEIWEVDNNTNCAIEIKGTPTLILKDTVGGGLFTSANPYKCVILNFSFDADISIEGGTYSGISNSKSIDSLLAEGFGYKNNDNSWVTDMSGSKIFNVTVAEAPLELFSVSVTEVDNSVQYHVGINKAITAAQGMSGCTVTLLKDVNTDSLVTVTGGTFTIDLNGKTWSGSYNLATVEIQGTTSVTIKDSGYSGKITNTKNWYTVYLSGETASLILQGGTYEGGNNGSIQYSYGNITDLLAEGYAYKNSDTLWVIDMSGNEISNVTVAPIPVKITTQPEDAVVTLNYTEAEAPIFTVTAQTVPADSGKDITYQWYENSAVIDGATSASYKVDTGLAEGTYTYYCAVSCEGYTVNSDNATLYVTSAEGNYEVTSSGGLTFKYPTLETAISAAKSKPNSTVKLLADATTADTVEVSSGTFTIDLNGKIWTSNASAAALNLTNGCHVTLMDSAAGGKITTSTASLTIRTNDADLTIKSGIYENENSSYMSQVLGAYSSGTVTIQGGTIQTSKSIMYLAYFQSVDVVISSGTFSGSVTAFNNCDSVALSGGEYKYITSNDTGIVANLLASGYGYKNKSDSTWVNNLGRNVLIYNDLANNTLPKPVTVQPVPAKIIAQPQNAASATYGYASAPTISVSAETTAAAPAGSDISYQWYRVKSGSETSDTALGTTSTQTLPTGLDAGTHSFYCKVTCDGYIVNSENATFTVEKATPTISLELMVHDDDPFIYGNEIYFTATVAGADGEYPDGTVTFMDGNDVLFADVAYSTSSQYYQENSDEVPAGDHNFAAVYTPSTDGTGKNYVGVTSEAVEQTIAKADQSALSITEVTGKKYGDAPFTLESTGGSGTGALTFSVPDNNGVLSVSGSTATIIGVGTVTITATKATDTNYNEATATQSITIEKADTSIAFKASYEGSYYCTGSPIPNPGEEDLSITGASYSDVIFAWCDIYGGALNGPPTAPGTYILMAVIQGTENINQSNDIKNGITISSYDGIVTAAYNSSTTKAAWYSADVAITADGYTVSDSIDGTYAPSYLLSGEGAVGKTLYFKQNGTGYITDGKSVTVNIDTTAPTFSGETDGITISDNNWKGFLNQITFGHFFKETKNVSISATDGGSGVDKYYYYIDTDSTTAKTAEELNNISFTEGASFSITDENKYIIYAYVVDHVGNKSAYICTDGIVIDKTAPTVTLTAPVGSDLGDVSGAAKVQMNETGIITYVIKTTEQSGMTAQNILDAADKKTVSVIDGQADTNLDVAFSGLTANNTYYMYAMGTDSAENNGSVVSTSFTTTITQPIFADNPTITGTYGQQVKDMMVSQVASTNGVAGSWSVSSTDKPSVGTLATYDVVFTPDDAVHYATVTVSVTPTITRKNLTATGVTIGEVTGTYTYDKTAKVPTVTVTDSEATITASDFEYSYSNNISAGMATATVTVTAKGNYTGTISRTFTIAKATAPSIDFPTASSITYGQKLSASTLSESITEYGNFAWTEGSTVPTVTNSGYEVTFTPNAGTVANYEAITSNTDTVAITVSKATPAVTVNTSVSDNAGSRKAILTATVTGAGDGETPTGTVKFVNSTSGSDEDIAGATAVTITGGKATYTWTGLASQIYKVKAVYSGSPNYNTANSTELEVDTNKQNQAALNIGSIGTKTYGDGAFILSTIGGSGGGAVTFESSDPSIVSISGTTATIQKAGSVTITVTKAATDTYNVVSASVSLIVGKKALTVKADNKLNIIKGGAMPALTYTVTGLVGSDTFTEPTLSTTATDTNTVGEYDITISGGTLANADNYTINYTSGKVTIINEPASPGGSSGGGSSDGGGSSTATPQPDAGTPVIKGASNKAGWEVIKEQISQTREGDTVTIEMNGSLVVPGEVLDAIRGTDTTLVFDMGDGITWSINGQSITANSLNDVNLGVTLDTDAIPAGIISQMSGEQASNTLSLAYDGLFGFTSVLTINLNKINAGKYGNLFYYNPETKRLTLQAVEKIGEKGTVELPFSHASDYVVIISEEPMLEKTLDQIEISAVKGTLYVGGTEKKSMTLKLELPQLLKEAVEQDSSILKITYQSSNPKVATVTASGKIKAKKAGKATVTTLVTINGVQRKFQTIITVSKAYIKLIGSTNTLKTGDTFTYKAVGYGVKTEVIMYYTSKKSVVEINKTTGKAKARTKGTDYIIAKVGKVIVKIKVKVS